MLESSTKARRHNQVNTQKFHWSATQFRDAGDLRFVAPYDHAVNRFLTMAWRARAQFGTLVHLVFSGVARANRITLERGGRLGCRMGRRGLANLEREIKDRFSCGPRGKRH